MLFQTCTESSTERSFVHFSSTEPAIGSFFRTHGDVKTPHTIIDVRGSLYKLINVLYQSPKVFYFWLIAAWAAESFAIGTLNGEQDT